MARNQLVKGEPRLGWLVDGNPETPDRAVMLQDTGTQIILTVPIKCEPADPYMRWFAQGIQFGDDPKRSKYSYQPPRVLVFKDSDGPVILVGCRSIGGPWNFGENAGHGRIVVNYAIIGGRSFRYEKINELRTELPALALWTGISSVDAVFQSDEQGRLARYEVTMESPSEIPIAHQLNLAIRPTWHKSRPDNTGTFEVKNSVQLKTSRSKPATWNEHLRLHDAVTNLAALSAWQPFGYSGLEVGLATDPPRVLSGDVVGQQWLPVATHRVRKHVPLERRPRFLFDYGDIGARGIRRWIKLHSHFTQALQPITSLLYSPDTSWETRIVQTGIALEALGYQLECDNPAGNLNNWGQLIFKKALEKILVDMPFIPLDDPKDWMERSRECYIGVKHADQEPPDSLVLANTYRENLLVLRFWLASRLGCDKQVLANRLNSDPLASEFVSYE